MSEDKEAFWRKPLTEMSGEEWELLCDGCGLCCRLKVEDEDTGEVVQTAVACRLLDTETCRCKDYDRRHELVPECILLTPRNILTFKWLPTSCAYRLLAEGHDLPDWHPLVTGDPDSAHRAGMSVKDRLISETHLGGNASDL